MWPSSPRRCRFPEVDPPDPATLVEKPDERLSVEELYLKGRKFHRGNRPAQGAAVLRKGAGPRPGHVAALRSLAVMDFEAALYARAMPRLQKALRRDGDDGLSWFYLGVCHLRLGNYSEAIRCGYRAARCPGTARIGYDLAGRAAMRLGDNGRRGGRVRKGGAGRQRSHCAGSPDTGTLRLGANRLPFVTVPNSG